MSQQVYALVLLSSYYLVIISVYHRELATDPAETCYNCVAITN